MADTPPVLYDPLDADTQQDPYPVYRRLRDLDPVHRTSQGYWVLSRFEDVFGAASDSATFSSAHGLTFEEDEILKLGLKPTLVMMDRPLHTTYRRLISRGFTPRKVLDLEPAVRAFVQARLATVVEAGDADFVEALAGPLPTFVVAGYLGVPESDRGQFGVWSDAIVQANATGHTLRDASGALGSLYRYFTELVNWRRQNPGEDMLSDLVSARIDGRPLELDEILGYCFVMIAGGNDTAGGLLGGAAVALCDLSRPASAACRRPWIDRWGGGGATPFHQPGAGPLPNHHPRGGPAGNPGPRTDQDPPALRIGQSRSPRVRPDRRPTRRHPSLRSNVDLRQRSPPLHRCGRRPSSGPGRPRRAAQGHALVRGRPANVAASPVDPSCGGTNHFP